MKVALFSALAAFTCTAASALAWNDFGHKAIAYIAYEDLTPQAKDRINAILAKHPQHEALVGKTKKMDEELLAFMGAATWPDMVRSPSNPLHATDHRSQWHYINLPLSFDGTKAPEPRFERKPGSDPENMLQAIDKCEADLRDPKLSDEEKAKLICWLMHLVGDLHQPLHAVALFRKDLPKGDRGGNLLWIGFDEKPINLHSFWDNVLGESKSAERVKEKAEALRTRKGLRREDLSKTLKVDTARAWADESAVLAKSTAYFDGKLDTTVAESRPATAPALPKGYVTAAEKAADERAALAGYRLADRLNKIFAGDGDPPIAEAADCCAYFEPFATVSIADCKSEQCEVRWCKGAETVNNDCASAGGRSLKVLASSTTTGWPVVWVSWGDRDVSEVRIELRYWQHQGNATNPDGASSRLEVKRSRTIAFDPDRCPTMGFTKVLDLPKTRTTDMTCFDTSVIVPVAKGEKAVYLRFAKSNYLPQTPLLSVDDLRITVVPTSAIKP